MSVAEAMSYALPVLTTTAVPWPELETQRCGWRVHPNASALAAGLRVAIGTSAGELEDMGLRGREVVSARNAWRAIAQQFVSIYEATAGAHPQV